MAPSTAGVIAQDLPLLTIRAAASLPKPISHDSARQSSVAASRRSRPCSKRASSPAGKSARPSIQHEPAASPRTGKQGDGQQPLTAAATPRARDTSARRRTADAGPPLAKVPPASDAASATTAAGLPMQATAPQHTPHQPQAPARRRVARQSSSKHAVGLRAASPSGRACSSAKAGDVQRTAGTGSTGVQDTPKRLNSRSGSGRRQSADRRRSSRDGGEHSSEAGAPKVAGARGTHPSVPLPRSQPDTRSGASLLHGNRLVPSTVSRPQSATGLCSHADSEACMVPVAPSEPNNAAVLLPPRPGSLTKGRLSGQPTMACALSQKVDLTAPVSRVPATPACPSQVQSPVGSSSCTVRNSIVKDDSQRQRASSGVFSFASCQSALPKRLGTVLDTATQTCRKVPGSTARCGRPYPCLPKGRVHEPGCKGGG